MASLRVVRDALLERFRPAPEFAVVGTEDRAVTGEAAVKRSRPELAWRRIALQAAALWLATRLAFVILTYFADILIQRDTTIGTLPFAPHALLDSWKRNDVNWFINIAQHGYWSPEPTAFFPLYPLLIKATTLVFGQHWLLAAMLISNLGTLGAFVGLALWAAQDGDGTRAEGIAPVRVLAAYPFALFLFAGYSDGLFLGLVVFCFFFLRRGAWGWAALCGFLAGLTRVTAAALILPMLWEYGRQQGWWRRASWRAGRWRERLGLRALAWAAVVVGSVPAAFALYELYVWRRFGDARAIVHAEEATWHHTPMSPFATIAAVARQLYHTSNWTFWQAHLLLDVAPVALFAALTLVLIRRQPFAYTLYMAALVYLVLGSPITGGFPDLLASAGRYMLVAAPVWLALGRWARRYPALDLFFLSAGFLVQGVLVAAFLRGDWLI